MMIQCVVYFNQQMGALKAVCQSKYTRVNVSLLLDGVSFVSKINLISIFSPKGLPFLFLKIWVTGFTSQINFLFQIRNFNFSSRCLWSYHRALQSSMVILFWDFVQQSIKPPLVSVHLPIHPPIDFFLFAVSLCLFFFLSVFLLVFGPAIRLFNFVESQT